MINIKPEVKAEMILWDWMINNNPKGNIEIIYFNRKNILNCKTFRVEGDMKIPDFILKIKDKYKIKYYAVEVKSSDKSINILQSSKILEYLKNYLENKTKYFIAYEKINLSGFLIATDKSPLGYLFKKEIWTDNTNKEGNKSKRDAATLYKIIPKKEGSRTFDFIRMLWREYTKFRKNYDKKLDVGIIIGNHEEENKPYIMVTHHNGKRWGQRWLRL